MQIFCQNCSALKQAVTRQLLQPSTILNPDIVQQGEEKTSCKPADRSQKCTSHMWIQVFGCVKGLEAINNTRKMMCLILKCTKDFISPGDR